MQLKIPADGKFIAKNTDCLFFSVTQHMPACHFRKLLLAATVTSSSVTITVNFWKIHYSSLCAFREFEALLQFTLQAELDVVMNKGDAVQLVCRQLAALRVQDVCGSYVMPKHRNDRKTYRTICVSYSKITAAKTTIFFWRFSG